MFIRIKERHNGKKSVQIVESIRRGDKVNQKVVRHVGQALNDNELEILKKLANSIIVEMENEKQPVLPIIKPEDIYSVNPKNRKETEATVKIKNIKEEQRIVDGIGEVFGELYTQLDFDDVISDTKKDKEWNEILKTIVISRLANPESKLRTSALLEKDYGIRLPVEKIYRMMDKIASREETIKERVLQSTLNLFQDKVNILFFDVTTLYFESVIADELKNFGYSKDNKFGEVQLVFALIATEYGLPVGYEVFPGNTSEGKTLIPVISDLKKKYNVANVCFAADRAMFTKENLEELDSLGINYVVAAKLKTLKKDLKDEILNCSNFKCYASESEINWYQELAHKNGRLIVNYSDKRAQKDAKDRQRIIDKLFKKAKNQRVNLKEIIGISVSKKYLKIKNKIAEIDYEKIESDSMWDGIHGVITNIKDKPVHEILKHYSGLWQIEEAFRVNKHDLRMRPIYHWTPSRIRAHLLICFLSYTLAKQAVYRVSNQQFKISFDRLREELLHVQSSVVIDTATKKKFVIPSNATPDQKRIYHAFGLKRDTVPYPYEK